MSYKAGFLASGVLPVTVAAQRGTCTRFRLLSPDIRASGHLVGQLVNVLIVLMLPQRIRFSP